jgi:phosphatidylglycerol---prolipoprotein diacylglyceryl transferase
MHPQLHVGDWLIQSYALFATLGWLAGGAVFYLEVRRRGWPLDKLLFAAVGCFFGAIVGGLAFGMLFFDWPEVVDRVTALELAGNSVVGGLAGGFLGVEIAKKLVGHTISTGEAFALAIPIGHAIGRVGCYLSGCCFGTPTTLPWGVTFPGASLAHTSQVTLGLVGAGDAPLPVHPTQLYEIAFDLVLFAALFIVRDRTRTRGSLFRAYLFAYATFRLMLELVRGDSPFPSAGGPKPIQVVLLGAALYFGWRLWKQEGPQRA